MGNIPYPIVNESRIDELFNEIQVGTKNRFVSKYDAYFDLPETITLDEIKILLGKINGLIIDDEQIYARLYAPQRIQTFWKTSPRRTTMEYFSGLAPIMDPELFMKCWNVFFDAQKDVMTK